MFLQIYSKIYLQMNSQYLSSRCNPKHVITISCASAVDLVRHPSNQCGSSGSAGFLRIEFVVEGGAGHIQMWMILRKIRFLCNYDQGQS
jgi:hypothetical protein